MSNLREYKTFAPGEPLSLPVKVYLGSIFHNPAKIKKLFPIERRAIANGARISTVEAST
ncbi:uncharacterized protein PHALS_14479 [Plasmopara halstedii]|uniref:Uncharacterized protein n=1 Tax=Plasmopara halstedii TaxID=4781 RepID=A0A0P1AS86_PLAHL|nr:uncharacterized protein PHALS_14479 [Plasmopara halstedii]CEG44220.1 hypothetical protein PHALS_14479 [Plasmopara halstedii]|eukprot:XP_024580589.1 hypothetical protein PHALS_14479 [Plasmopara halstedii]